MNIIDISKSKHISLKFAQIDEYRQAENKGWSYSCVYSLEEVRDIYMLLSLVVFKNLKDFTANHVIPKVKSRGKDWSNRRVLEILNALVNFKLAIRNKETGSYEVAPNAPVFETESFGKPLSSKDIQLLRKVFFEYSRFQEFIGLYLDSHNDCSEESTLACSNPVYSIRNNQRYTDAFFLNTDNVEELKVINPVDAKGKKNTSCMMFWDVFISWAKELQLLESFNSKLFDYTLSNGKGFSCSYFLSHDSVTLPSLPQLIMMYFPQEKMIDTNKIIWKICTVYRKSLTEAKEYVVEQYKLNKSLLAPVRTSEIFVNKSENRNEDKVAYPRYKDSYISHLMTKKVQV